MRAGLIAIGLVVGLCLVMACAAPIPPGPIADRPNAILAVAREYATEVRAGDPHAAAAGSIQDFRGAMVFELSRIVVDTAGKQDIESRNAFRAAIGILRDLRAEEASTIMVDHLTVQYVGRPKLGQRLITTFPCAVALVSIGVRGLEPLVDRAAATDDPRFLALAAFVIQEVLGKRVGTAYVDQRIGTGGAALTDAARERLGSLRGYVSGDRDYDAALRQ